MHIIFDVNLQDLQQKARLVVGVHGVDSTEHTTYSSTTKDMYVRFMLLIALKKGLGLMDGNIGNALCMSPCAENIWSCCGAEFGPRCGAVVVRKQDLYGLKTASNSFHKYFGGFIRYLGFTISRLYQYLWIRKSDRYERYEYIATHVDGIIIAANNPSKYMHEFDMQFMVRDIPGSPNYYIVNELVGVGDSIHASSKYYLNEILRKYQKKHGDLKGGVLHMRFK